MTAAPAAAPRTLAEWLAYQETLHGQVIALGLDRVRAVAERLQLLETGCVSITVGGTNGKGSSTRLIADSYRAAGYRVGAYSSPHLYRYNERIVLNGEAVSDTQLCKAFAAIEQGRAGQSLTYFEFGTLAALWLFKQAGVDVQVLEVGLGGRLDAVNIIDADAALITNIGLDHQDWLGDTRDAIGFEKAGIVRRGRIAVSVDPEPPRGLIEAIHTHAPQIFLRLDAGDFSVAGRNGPHWQYRDTQAAFWLPDSALAGEHQRRNAAGTIALMQALRARLPIEPHHYATALQGLKLPGRLEWRGRFLLDVSHNAESAQALADYLAMAFPHTRLVWLAGVLADKPLAAIAERLAPHVCGVVTLTLDGPRGQSAAALATALRSALPVDIPVLAGGDAASSLALAGTAFPADTRILICGSFHTVAALAPLIAHDSPGF